MQEEDFLARWCQLMGQRAPTGAGADNDDVVMEDIADLPDAGMESKQHTGSYSGNLDPNKHIARKGW